MKPSILAAIVVLASISIFLAIVLPPKPVKRSTICPVHSVLRTDGSIEFGGAVFSKLDEFKVRLVSYKKEKPDCFLSIISDRAVRPELISRAASAMHEAGFSSVGFLTEPHSLSREIPASFFALPTASSNISVVSTPALVL